MRAEQSFTDGLFNNHAVYVSLVRLSIWFCCTCLQEIVIALQPVKQPCHWLSRMWTPLGAQFSRLSLNGEATDSSGMANLLSA